MPPIFSVVKQCQCSAGSGNILGRLGMQSGRIFYFCACLGAGYPFVGLNETSPFQYSVDNVGIENSGT